MSSNLKPSNKRKKALIHNANCLLSLVNNSKLILTPFKTPTTFTKNSSHSPVVATDRLRSIFSSKDLKVMSMQKELQKRKICEDVYKFKMKKLNRLMHKIKTKTDSLHKTVNKACCEISSSENLYNVKSSIDCDRDIELSYLHKKLMKLKGTPITNTKVKMTTPKENIKINTMSIKRLEYLKQRLKCVLVNTTKRLILLDSKICTKNEL